MDRTKIVVAHFINQLHIGGAEEICRIQQKYLDHSNIECYYFATSEDTMGDEIRLHGGNVIIQPIDTNIKFCYHLQPDIIIMHTAGYIPYEAPILQQACPNAKKCIVIHSPQTLPTQPNYIDLLICVSDMVYNMQIFDNKITIKNGIDIEKINKIDISEDEYIKLGLKKENVTIGRLSRIAPDKLTSDFILAASKIIDKCVNIQFMIVGEAKETLHPGYLKSIHELIKQINMTEHIKFVGVQRNLSKYLSMIDILMNPTMNESFGCVFSEAMAAKVPVVTYDLHANKETVIDGFNGLLAEGRNVDDLASKTISLATDKLKRIELGNNGRRFVEQNCNGKIMGQKYSQLYHQLAGR